MSGRTEEYARRVAAARSIDERLDLAARWILAEFDAYYVESRNIPTLAKAAFERRDPAASLDLSLRRLSVYSVSAHSLARRLREALPSVADDETFWARLEARYLALIEGRYESDLAFAYVHSARRMVYEGMWKPVEYAFLHHREPASERSAGVRLDFPIAPGADLATLVDRILDIPRFERGWRDREGDVRRAAERIESILGGDARRPAGVQMTDAGFFRNRGAYVVGRIVFDDGSATPLILALLNHEAGIHVQAVLVGEADAHNLFSSTLANFHVTNTHYHELAAFLHTVMPTRRLGLHYSTIGFNHVGKVAVMNELREELATRGEVFTPAVGFRGSVAIGFAAPSSDYNLKVIRDVPTDQYKWGEFPGIRAVLDKYRRVHEIDRTGSMLDNIIYYNLELDPAWFEPDLPRGAVARRGRERVVARRGRDHEAPHRPAPGASAARVPAGRDAGGGPRGDRQPRALHQEQRRGQRLQQGPRRPQLRGQPFPQGLPVRLRRPGAAHPRQGPLERRALRGRGRRPRLVLRGRCRLPARGDRIGLPPARPGVAPAVPGRARRPHDPRYWERMQDDLERGRVPGIRLYPEQRKLDHPGCRTRRPGNERPGSGRPGSDRPEGRGHHQRRNRMHYRINPVEWTDSAEFPQ